jgi:hypothetical protein
MLISVVDGSINIHVCDACSPFRAVVCLYKNISDENCCPNEVIDLGKDITAGNCVDTVTYLWKNVIDYDCPNKVIFLSGKIPDGN